MPLTPVSLKMGSTEECFRRLLEEYSPESIHPLVAEFCKVETLTVSQWAKGKRFPQGDALVRLQTFLSLAGYQVNELAEVPKSVRSLAMGLALDIFSMEDIMQKLEYRNSQEVYRLIRKGGLVPRRQTRLKDLVEKTEGDLKSRQAAWRARIEDLTDGEVPRASDAEVSEVSEEAVATQPLKEPAAEAPAEQPEPLPAAPPVRPILGYERAILADHLVAALSALLENGDLTTMMSSVKPDPRPLPKNERLLISTVVDSDRRQRLVAQLLLLDSDSSL